MAFRWICLFVLAFGTFAVLVASCSNAGSSTPGPDGGGGTPDGGTQDSGAAETGASSGRVSLTLRRVP